MAPSFGATKKNQTFDYRPSLGGKNNYFEIVCVMQLVAKVPKVQVIVPVVCRCQNWTLPISHDIIVAYMCNSAKGQPSQDTVTQITRYCLHPDTSCHGDVDQ